MAEQKIHSRKRQKVGYIMERYTIKELKKMDDLQLIQNILQERANTLTNPYSPLAERLHELVNKVCAYRFTEDGKKFNDTMNVNKVTEE